MRKNAKDMFKKIGFESFKYENDDECDKQWGFKTSIRYKTEDDVIEIHFDLLDEDYSIRSNVCGQHPSVSIGMNLHCAICKQIEELGWKSDRW